MSEGKYTPGPWEVGSLCDSEFFAYNIAGQDGYHVAKASSRSEIETSANARLISAAPELLEALERILEDEEVALSRPDYVFAHEAVAKARGQS